MQKTAVLVAVILVIIATGLTVFLHASGQNYNIPSWVKNNAGWWAEGKIGDSDFVNGIQYLIEQKIMVIPETKPISKSSQEIPTWIKNNAKWWSEGTIGDADFVNGIQYLIQQGIMIIDTDKGTFDVIVIGAGISGLAAADNLDSKGYDVVVLEARDRIGGRTWTSHSLNNIPLDLGAAWIHGIFGNPLKEIADKHEIKTMVTDYDSETLYDFDGKEITGERLSKFWKRSENFESFLEYEREREYDYDTALQDVVDDFIVKENLSDESLRDFLYTLNVNIEHEYGADASDLSLFEFDQDDYLVGEDVVFPHGYEQILNVLAEGLDIRLKHVVKEVNYSGELVVVTTNNGEFEAKYVISTLPLGVLKHGDVKFIPSLPSWKTNAMKNLEMGVLNRVVLLFPEVFWDQTDLIGYVSEEKGRWAEFYNYHKYTNLPILVAFNAGEYGRQIESQSDKEIVEEEMSILRKIYGNDIPEPEGFLVTRWASDEFSRGSYSYIKVGGSGDDFDAMAKPLMDKVFFAGEATSRNKPATAHGAYLTGIREAERIHQLELK